MRKLTIFSFILLLCSNLLPSNTKLLIGDINISLDQSLEQKIERKFSFLNDSDFFKMRNLRSIKWVRQQIESSSEDISKVSLETNDGTVVPALFLNRNSDKVIIMASGLGVTMEHMMIFTKIFPNYDILIFNFRGNSYPSRFDPHPLRHLFRLDFNCSLGTKEEQEVFAAVDFAHSKKDYREIIGFSVCYGALIFAKAQAMMEDTGRRLFNKLILDGCWTSITSIIKKYSRDPKLIIDNQRGGWENYYVFKSGWLEGVMDWLARHLFSHDIHELNLLRYLNSIQIPILLTHGTQDKLTSNQEFEAIWRSIASKNKVALITDCTHARTFLKKKGLFTLVTNAFIDARSINHLLSYF